MTCDGVQSDRLAQRYAGEQVPDLRTTRPRAKTERWVLVMVAVFSGRFPARMPRGHPTCPPGGTCGTPTTKRPLVEARR